MRVLNLVTSAGSPFFRDQVAALERRGVTCDTLEVPGPPTDRTPLDYLRYAVRVRRHDTDRYDVVHANYGLTAPAALLQSTRPVVLSLWGSDLMGAYGWLSRACARRADAVVVPSRVMADALGRDSRVVPFGVALDEFRPRDPDAARADVGWPGERVQVLFPYDPARDVKDYPRACRVVARARERLDRPVDLRVVTGVPHDRMAAYMNAADVLLVTSRREAGPMVVKEALACNLPVVSTDVGDVREYVADVTPSRVCRTDDALVDALVDVVRRGERSDGRAAVADLTTDATARRLEAVYEDVLASARRGTVDGAGRADHA